MRYRKNRRRGGSRRSRTKSKKAYYVSRGGIRL